MKSLVTVLAFAGVSAASAHPSLIAHDHPHGLSALAGLDTLVLAALVLAFALAVWKQVRS
jgi:hypothetical protein